MGRIKSTWLLSVVLCFVLNGLSSVTLAEAPAGGAQTEFTIPHVPAQILVLREAGTPTSIIDQLLAGFGGAVIQTSATSGIDVVEITDDTDLEAAIAILEADAGINYAEPNYTSNLWATPNDIDFPQQWSKDNNGINAPGGLGHAGADLNLVAAWDDQATAPGVIIAIIDDSLETTHIDLAANVMATGKCFASPNSARPCTNGPDNPNPADANDFHGTLVAGTAAARGDNGIGVAGAVWETNLLPLKVDLSYFAIVEAIDEAISQNATIINMSFGGPVGSRSLSDAIDRAEADGILMIASAGNADANNAVASHFPSDSPQNNIISVASSDSRDRISDFSQWGPDSVDIAAPGDLVRTTANGNSFATASGTSFSAPHVAGVAALIYANVPTADYRQVKAQLLDGTVNGQDALGPVIPGQDDEAIPGRVATGRLDADLALTTLSTGVLFVDSIAVDDTATGNANGKLDPGETAQVQITLRNAWNAESGVSGTLSTIDNAELIINDITPVLFGDIPKDATATANFNVTLSNGIADNRQLFLQLDVSSATSGALPSRYFYLETGTLQNGQTISQDIQRYDWDEFQAFNIDVPAGASDLNITTTGSGDIDLLLRYAQSPEYLITLNVPPGDGFYYVDSESQISSTDDANESITVASPLPGTYHVVVVNYDQQAKSYDIAANYSLPSAGEIQFSAMTYNVSEGDGSATITVSRSGGVGGATVDFSTTDQTAIAGSDYATTSGSLSWGLGENGNKSFSVPVFDDSDVEQLETLQIVLSNVNGATLGQNSVAQLEISDNEAATGLLAFELASYAVSENAGQVTISVIRTSGTQGSASVDYATQAGQAVAGSDFSSATGTLNWADGESDTKFIDISIVNDATPENQESFSIILSNVQGANIGLQSSATVTVSDDDVASTNNTSGGGGASNYWLVLLLSLLFAERKRRLSNKFRS